MPDYSAGVILAWRMAAAEAIASKHEFILREHLLMGLAALEAALVAATLDIPADHTSDSESAEAEIRRFTKFLRESNLDLARMRQKLRHLLGTGQRSEDAKETMHRDADCRAVFSWAVAYAPADAHAINAFHLLAALLSRPGVKVAQAIASGGGDVETMQQALLKELGLTEIPESPAAAKPAPSGPLSKYGVDLTALAEDGAIEPLIGRKNELLELVRALSRKTKNNPLLLGDPGVGKTALVRALASRIAERKVPASLQDKSIIELNLGAVIAGTRYRGDLETRITEILKETEARPEVILFIDEIHILVGAGASEGGVDAANLMKPALAGSTLHCIGSTTLAEYRKYFERDAALARRFQPIVIQEPSRSEALEILEGLRTHYEKHHGVRIDASALQSAVALSIRFIPSRKLPDKALDLLDEACTRVKIATLSFQSIDGELVSEKTVTGENVAQVVAERTGIPVARITSEGREKLLHMEESLSRRVMGQPGAIETIARLMTMARAGLRDPRKPVAVVLFVGPTGVGKTELAKALAEFLFGTEDDMIRIDMSEYKEKHSVSRLIGSPPGYIGHDEEGQLTGALRLKPYSVVLFDEVEKAHPEVCDLFLQLFDDGKLTDAHGRTVDGKNAIYIMTSTIAVPDAPGRKLGFGAQQEPALEEESEHRKLIQQTLSREFRTEFLNRIDEVVVFHPLTIESIQAVAMKLLERVRATLAEQDIQIRFSQDAIELIASKAYEPANGARPLARVIDRMVIGPLSRKTVAGEVRPGDSIDVVREGTAISFLIAERAEGVPPASQA
jgi:ATP-dependent Clp protease ATP-binding subunit ClpC